MENQRVRITKMLLKDALTKLLYEKKIEKITVSELCEKAGINRSTFYKHYGSQFDVLDDIEKDFFDAVTEMIPKEKENGKSGICRLLEFLRSEREKTYVIIFLASNESFIKRVFDIPALRDFSEDNINSNFTDRQNEYIRIFEYNGGFSVIREWVASGCIEDPEEIEELLMYVSHHTLT